MNILALLAGGYAIVAGVAFASQRNLLYPAPRRPIEPQLPGATLWRLPGAGGRTVFALHLPAPGERRTLVHFHGNGEELADQEGFVRALGGRGLGVLAVEYPGYGLSRDEAPSETAIYQDAEVALRHLAAQGVSGERLVLCGQSLGTGVAVEMARRGHGSRLVLLSPFTSIVDMAARVLPILPNRWLVRDRYDNLAKAPSLALPALVIHGSDDELIPVAMGRRVSDALLNAEFMLVDGAHHNDLFARDGNALLDRIASFAAAATTP